MYVCANILTKWTDCFRLYSTRPQIVVELCEADEEQQSTLFGKMLVWHSSAKYHFATTKKWLTNFQNGRCMRCCSKKFCNPLAENDTKNTVSTARFDPFVTFWHDQYSNSCKIIQNLFTCTHVLNCVTVHYYSNFFQFGNFGIVKHRISSFEMAKFFPVNTALCSGPCTTLGLWSRCTNAGYLSQHAEQLCRAACVAPFKVHVRRCQCSLALMHECCWNTVHLCINGPVTAETNRAAMRPSGFPYRHQRPSAFVSDDCRVWRRDRTCIWAVGGSISSHYWCPHCWTRSREREVVSVWRLV